MNWTQLQQKMSKYGKPEYQPCDPIYVVSVGREVYSGQYGKIYEITIREPTGDYGARYYVSAGSPPPTMGRHDVACQVKEYNGTSEYTFKSPSAKKLQPSSGGGNSDPVLTERIIRGNAANALASATLSFINDEATYWAFLQKLSSYIKTGNVSNTLAPPASVPSAAFPPPAPATPAAFPPPQPANESDIPF